MNTLIGANVSSPPHCMSQTNTFQVLLGLAAGVHTCYGLTVGEICPNKYKFLGVVFCVIPSCIPTGFGAYLGTKQSPALFT